ncbi:YigZ family protein [Cellulosimicrobium sp. CUA-896]|uniref:IMPACT family protein n=1 Tax=Cellulosimicrobium sp. CUA-896 TaxID=1517881 RepID=UPI0009620BA6|nr:YigZ family protein [Cellulosimicrobium sp. CUA-896]OLT52438.1 YigZ family protein [Cellulosimicrobium sp. CUA-896]
MDAPNLPSTIAAPVDHELVVKKSRFLAHLSPVSGVPEADAVVAAVRKEHWDARHHCVALVVGAHADQQRSTDDGEPSGTAGVPMLEVLRHRGVTDLVAVVTRYFGGVLLGAGGLVRAYSSAVGDALAEARLVRRAVRTHVTVDVPHAEAGRLHGVLQGWAAAHDAVLAGVAYEAEARFRLLVAPGDLDRFDADLAAASSGALSARRGDDRVVDLPG